MRSIPDIIFTSHKLKSISSAHHLLDKIPHRASKTLNLSPTTCSTKILRNLWLPKSNKPHVDRVRLPVHPLLPHDSHPRHKTNPSLTHVFVTHGLESDLPPSMPECQFNNAGSLIFHFSGPSTIRTFKPLKLSDGPKFSP